MHLPSVDRKQATRGGANGQSNMCLTHVAASLRTIAMDTPKSFATLAGLKPALTAARTILAFAGGMSGMGAALRMILAATGVVRFSNGAIPWPLLLASETEPIPRRRASPMATRIRSINSSFSSWPTPCTRSGSCARRFWRGAWRPAGEDGRSKRVNCVSVLAGMDMMWSEGQG
jgi:hypothetical protein